MAGGLARALNAPGGITVAQAEQRAAARLDEISEHCLDSVRDALADIEERCPPGGGALPPDVRRELHQRSCSIAGLAGMFQRDALSKAAYCFCRLIDETEPGWNSMAADLHVQGMRLLMSPEGSPPEVQARLLDGLDKVRKLAAAGKI